MVVRYTGQVPATRPQHAQLYRVKTDDYAQVCVVVLPKLQMSVLAVKWRSVLCETRIISLRQ